MKIGEHISTRAGAFRFSPFLFPQEAWFNRFFLPKLRDLPYHGLRFAMKTFDFGFNPQNASLDPYDTQYQSITFRQNMLVHGITGTSSPADGSTPVTPAFLFQFLHTHTDPSGSSQRQWFGKPVSEVEQAGTAQDPFILTEPQLVLAGDQIQIQMQNLTGAELNAQLCLLGGEF